MNRLDKLRDELAEKRASYQASSGCKHTDEVWRRHLRIGYIDGFDVASAEYEKIIKELEKALKYIAEGDDHLAESEQQEAREALSKLKEFRGEK